MGVNETRIALPSALLGLLFSKPTLGREQGTTGWGVKNFAIRVSFWAPGQAVGFLSKTVKGWRC